MRILVCCNRDFASNVALNQLVPQLAGHDLALALSERVGAATTDLPWQRDELRQAEQVLPNQVWFPLLESCGRSGRAGRWVTFSQASDEYGISPVAIPNPNRGEGLEALRRFAPDLMVTIRYGHILKHEAIAVPRLGVLNLHSGLLPDYRGVLATFRALMNGDSDIGCTAHWISDGTIDTGAILGTARIPVRRDRSLLWHVLALYAPGVQLLADAITSLAADERPSSVPQREGGAYYTYPTPAEWDAFTEAGWTIAQMRDLAEWWPRYCA